MFYKKFAKQMKSYYRLGKPVSNLKWFIIVKRVVQIIVCLSTGSAIIHRRRE